MQTLIDRSTVPPDGFGYFQPETRVRVKAADYFNLFENVKKHRLANNIPIGPAWQAEIEDQLCKGLPPGWCKELQPGKLPVNVATRIDLQALERGASVFVDWALKGAPVVSQEIAERRAQICAGCYYNVGTPGGCKSCGSAVNMIKRAVGNRSTLSERFLKICAVCRCYNAVQVWFPVEQLAKGVTPEMMPLWPDFCWKGKELKEFYG